MSGSGYRKALVASVAAVLLAGAAFWAQTRLVRRCPLGRPSSSAGLFTAFGAFRSLAAEIVWFRADRLKEEGRYGELAQLAKALTMSEPHTPEVWSYASWNLAYNVSVMMPDPADRWRWVQSGMRLLRDDGLRYNPESAEIHRELASLFEFKMGLDTDSAAPYYRARWREIVDDVTRRNAWDELRMRPDVMQAIEWRLRVFDRGDPLYSAIYWAELGLAHAQGHDRVYLEEIIRQSLALYRRRHGQDFDNTKTKEK